MKAGERIEVEAERLDEAGAGVGEADGGSVHVADLLPGERALVAVDHVSPHRPEAWARIDERRGPVSADRVEPPCPGFGRCGGCAWQHLAYPAQLAGKRDRVVRALARLAEPPEVAPIRPAPAELGYRNRGKYVIGTSGGRTTLGAYRPRSHELVDTVGCRVVAPAIDRAASAARDLLEHSGLPVYDERQRTGQLRYLVLRAGADGRVLACLVTTSAADRAAIDRFAADLLGQVAGVSWAVNDLPTGAIFDAARPALPIAGEPTLVEQIGDARLELDATAFFQVNRDQALALYADLAERTGAGPGTRALDLYCGVGGIAMTLAARGAEVVGVERHRAAVDAATAAGSRARFACGSAADLDRLAPGRFDLVVVNPPRKGLDPATRAAVRGLAPATLAYVSCGPGSLARDLDELAADYAIASVTPYDLMPGTAQVETLVILRRRAAPA